MRGGSRATLAAAALAAAAALFSALPRPPRFDVRTLVPAGPRDVRILRDTWGVPHVFGTTDADAAYGLAWAHAEDDFPTLQGALLAARGRLATLLGPAGAPNDYMVALLRVQDVVDAGYPRLPADVRALCEAYAAGLNHHAATHPREAIDGLYPLRGADVVAGFVHRMPLFFGVDRVLRELLEPDAAVPRRSYPLGSNAVAVAPRRSADGATRLLVNSHQPWTGPVAWYEAHVKSEEGWEAVGGLFPGAPVILHGHNRRLGWAHTVNRPDLVDVYALAMHPDDPLAYRFDGAWRRLESRTAEIEVKLLGPLRWTFRREVLWSVHGPALRTPRGVFALRIAGQGEVGHVLQWYRMNRARTLAEWMDAMRLRGLPTLNVAYADAEGHVGYVYNARLPRRAPGHDWTRPVRGDTSALVWTEDLPFDRLPMVVDPPSGFVQNCNNTPFRTTTGEGNPPPPEAAVAGAIETHMTNRALRALELFGGDPSITAEEFDAYKFDDAYAEASALAGRWRDALGGPGEQDGAASAALAHLARWDRRADAANRVAALAILALRPSDDDALAPLPRAELRERLRGAAAHLRRTHGRIDPPWGEVNRLRRGGVDLPLDGAPDVLRAVYARRARDGRLEAVAGDSYVLVVEWDAAGSVRSRSVQPFGAAPLDRRSPHYADQAALFAGRRYKPVWFEEAEVRAHLAREYRPGAPRR